MRLFFNSDVPLWEQMRRAGDRRHVGRKHNHTIGPTRKQKKQPPNDVKRKAALRKYKELMTLYFSGARDTRPIHPREKLKEKTR